MISINLFVVFAALFLTLVLGASRGEPCTDDGDCNNNLVCHETNGNMYCVRKKGRGKSCEDSTQFICKDHLDCEPNDSADKTCKKARGIDGECGDTGFTCLPDLECLNGLCRPAPSVSPAISSTSSTSSIPSVTPTSSTTASISSVPSASRTSSPIPSTSPVPSASQSSSPTPIFSDPRDPHGIKLMYASEDTSNPTSFQSNDWVSSWETYTAPVGLPNSLDVDPNDDRARKRGSGEITISGGEAQFNKSPRLYISSDPGPGWENVEFTAYGYYADSCDWSANSASGLTLVARSSHFFFSPLACENGDYPGEVCSPCSAVGYYTRIYRDPSGSNEIMFQKEYYHGDSGSIYAATKRTTYFPGKQLPTDTWIGMKFVVYTIPGTDHVKLKLYIDETDGANGGDWILVHEYTDTPDTWFASGGEDVPGECTEVPNGGTILGPKQDCFLRSDSSCVNWKKASIRRIDPAVLLPQ